MKLYNLYQEVILEEAKKQLNLLTEAANMDTIRKAIEDRYEARIYYRDYDDGTPPSYRYVQIYVLGTTKAGNQAIRIYQRGGQSVKTKRGGWKTFRVDRIESVELVNKRFRNPITYGALYSNEPPYNELGDNTFVSIQLQVDPAVFTISKRGLVPIEKQPEEPLRTPREPEKEPDKELSKPLVMKPKVRKQPEAPGKAPDKVRPNRRPEEPEVNVVSGQAKPKKPEPIVGPTKPIEPEIGNKEEI